VQKGDSVEGIKLKTFIAGHRGMVGSALLRDISGDTVTRTSSELDLTDQTAVARFFKQEKPERVLLCAAKVGGIHANNTYPAEFIYENLMIQSNVIHQAYVAAICNCQNRRHQIVRELQSSVWCRLPQRDANQSLWPR